MTIVLKPTNAEPRNKCNKSTTGHRFHFGCVGTYFNRIRKMECPYCRKVDTNGRWRLAYILRTYDQDEELQDMQDLGCSLCNLEFGDLKPDVTLVECGHKFHGDCLGYYCNC